MRSALETFATCGGGVRSTLGAVAAGALLALAAPPIDAWVLGFVALVPLLLAIRTATPGRAFALGFLAGVVAHGASQAWWWPVVERFTDLPRPAAASVATLIVSSEALVLGIWAALARWWVRRFGVTWLLAAPLSLAIVESTVPSLFRWHLGVVLWRSWGLTQVAELGGAAAVSALVAAGNSIVAEGLSTGGRRVFARADLTAAVLVLAAVVSGGLLRSQAVEGAVAEAKRIRVGLLQPNFPALSREERGRHSAAMLRTLREGTRRLARDGADLIAWPEVGWPFFLDRDLARMFPEGHPWSLGSWGASRLVIGAATHQFGTTLLYNSALLVAPSGDIEGRYDKQRLLALAEYVPFERRFPRWGETVWRHLRDRHSMTPGENAQILLAGPVRAGVLLCSEELYPDLAARRYQDGANLLLGMSNDSWFASRAAAHQHLALAVFRAIETRRALVHVTTSGVSAVIDPLGRVRTQIPWLEVSGVAGQEPSLVVSEVTLVETAALGPTTVRYFWLGCLAVLILAIPAEKARSDRARRRRQR